MSVYNGARFVRQAVDSILAQTMADFEFIILDDASADGTLEILRSYRDPRILILRNNRNVGLAASLNRGISEACGVYVARQDADDHSHPDRLLQQARYLDQNPGVGVVGTATRWIDDEQNLLQIWPLGMDNPELQQHLMRTCWLIHGSTMYRRRSVKELGGYDTAMRTGQDYDLWLRMSETWDLVSLPDVLYVFRRHTNAVSESCREEQMRNVEIGLARAIQRRTSYARLAMGLGRDHVPARLRAMTRRQLAQRYVWWSAGARELSRRIAWQYLLIALLFDPTTPEIWSYARGISARKLGLRAQAGCGTRPKKGGRCPQKGGISPPSEVDRGEI
jgi:glycosyltransferase involved in cell wall biosynthesis